MKAAYRVLLTVLFTAAIILAQAPSITQAQAKKLTPGYYAGRFYYTADWLMLNDQSQGNLKSHLNYAGNVYIEGVIYLQVEKNGNFRSGVKIQPNSVTTYELHTFSLAPTSCSVTGYLSGDAGGKIKANSSAPLNSKIPFITASVALNNSSPMYYKKMGNDQECSYVPSQPLLQNYSNNHIAVLNKLKSMKFVVVNYAEDFINGTITVTGFAKDTPSKGGYIKTTEDGFFLIHRFEPLAALDDDSLAPLVDDSIAPLGEWRTK